MSGPIILGIIIVAIILLVKYPAYAKRIFVGVGQATVGFEFKNVLSVILVFVGVAIFYFGVYTSSSKSPNLADVGRMSRDHWLPILVLWGISAVLIALNTTGITAKTLQKIAAVIMAVVLVGLPAWSSWTSRPSAPTTKHKAPVESPMRRVLSQNASGIPWAWHMDKGEWPRIKVPPNGNSVRVPSIFGGHIVWGGSGFKVHCVYADGHEGIVGDKENPCSDGDIVEAYASNDSDVLLYASYAYARRGEK